MPISRIFLASNRAAHALVIESYSAQRNQRFPLLLDRPDVRCIRSLLPILDFGFDCLTFCQCLEAISLIHSVNNTNLRFKAGVMTYLVCIEVGKDVFAPIIRRDVAKFFGLVSRLDFAFESGHLGYCPEVLRVLSIRLGPVKLFGILN